jgi:hypothetical protein
VPRTGVPRTGVSRTGVPRRRTKGRRTDAAHPGREPTAVCQSCLLTGPSDRGVLGETCWGWTPGGGPRAVDQGRCTKGGAPRAVHQGRWTKGGGPRAVHQGRCTKGGGRRAADPERRAQGGVLRLRRAGRGLGAVRRRGAAAQSRAAGYRPCCRNVVSRETIGRGPCRRHHGRGERSVRYVRSRSRARDGVSEGRLPQEHDNCGAHGY